MSSDLLAAALCALGGVVAGLFAPRLIARLREPEREAPGPPRPLFVDLSLARWLGARLAVVGAGFGALVGWQVGWTPALAAWAYLTGVCVVLGYVDARTRLLPTQLIAPSYAVVALLLVVAGVVDRDAGEIWGAFVGWVVMGGFYVLMWRLGPRGLGYGDVRLSGLLALCLGFEGWGEMVTGLYAGFFLGGISSLVLVMTRRVTFKTAIPFGPFMMLGTLIGLIWGHSLSHWYVAR